MKVKLFLLMAIFCLDMHDGRSQTVLRFGAKGSVGTIIPHSSDLLPLAQTKPLGFNGSVQYMGTGAKSWEVCNCFYYLGLDLFYYNFNHPSVLGSASGISGTFEPMLWRNGPWRLSLASGIGFSYLNKVYDPVDNPDNLFFSQHLSFLLFVSPTLEYRISPGWSAHTGIAYNHISNGGQKQPNKGMNFPAVSIGAFRYLSREDLPDYEKPPFAHSWQRYTSLAFTTKSAAGGSNRKPVVMLAAEAYHPLGPVNALGLGVDIDKDYFLDTEKSFWESMTAAPFIAHHFTLGKTDFSQSMAIYFYKPENIDNHRFYQRYILRYRVLSHLSAGIGLKAHGHVAENIDVRLAWHW